MYEDYFNNSDKNFFATRSVFSYILPLEFKLGDVFDSVNTDSFEDNKYDNEAESRLKLTEKVWKLL